MRNPFLFGAPLVGGLLGGFLGSALFNYPRPYAYPPGPYGYGGAPYGFGAGAPYGGYPASINKNGLHRCRPFLSDDFYLGHIVVLLLLKHDFQKAILIDGFCSFAFD